MKRTAVTLVEIMVAVFILVIALIPVMRTLGFSLTGTKRDYIITCGLMLAKDKYERLKVFEYKDLNPGEFPVKLNQTVTLRDGKNTEIVLGRETYSGEVFYSKLKVSLIDGVEIHWNPIIFRANFNEGDPSTWHFGNLESRVINGKVKLCELEIWYEYKGRKYSLIKLATFKVDLS